MGLASSTDLRLRTSAIASLNQLSQQSKSISPSLQEALTAGNHPANAWINVLFIDAHIGQEGGLAGAYDPIGDTDSVPVETVVPMATGPAALTLTASGQPSQCVLHTVPRHLVPRGLALSAGLAIWLLVLAYGRHLVPALRQVRFSEACLLLFSAIILGLGLALLLALVVGAMRAARAEPES